MPRIVYHLRVIWACMNKEIKSALTERIGVVIGVFLPLNFLILMSLFALSGGLAPTAVVMQDTGPYARQFYDAMAHAHSFRLQMASPQEAQEWERATINELLLSPASRWAIAMGKMVGALVMSVASVVVVLAVLIFIIGVWPMHWDEVIGFTLLTMVIFVAYGTLLGTLLKQRQAFAVLALASVLPLFGLSGVFGPIAFSPLIVQVISQLFPPYYAIVLQQHAFHGFDLNAYGLGANVLILCVYAIVLVVLASLVLRRSTVAR